MSQEQFVQALGLSKLTSLILYNAFDGLGSIPARQ